MSEGETSFLDLTVRELLEEVAARSTAPGGGASAALAVALAAALAGMTARFSDEERLAELADALRARAAPLADADASAYGAFLGALRMPRDDPARADAVASARERATAVPVEIAEVAGAVSELAAGLARDGNPNLCGDAVAAVLLAAAAAGTAAQLVAANVTDADADFRLDRARDIAATAGARANELT